jgi:uncharacterized membrane protein YbhN (UPF0104 family)
VHDGPPVGRTVAGSVGNHDGRSRYLRLGLRAAFTVILLTLLARHVEWRRVVTLLHGVRPGPLALGLATFLAAQLLSAAKWRWIAVHLRCDGWLARHVRLYFAGMFLSLFLPGFVGGDLFRAAGLAGVERRWLPTRTTLWSVILERVTGLWGLVLLLTMGLTVSGQMFDDTGWLAPAGGAGAVGVVLFAAAAGRSARGGALAGRLESLGAPHGAPAPVTRVLAASLVVQLLYALVHLLLAVALGTGVAGRHWLWIAPAVGLVASLPVSLGGLGAREWAYLVSLGLVGLDREEAVAFASLWLMLVTTVSVAGGSTLLGGRRPALSAKDR